MAQIITTNSPDFKTSLCVLALLILCGASFFYRLGYLPMLGPDEPRYCEVAVEMYESGDWITPNLAGIHWFEKPALTYWLIAASYKIFGVSEFSSRLPVALFSSLGVFVLFWFGRYFHSNRFGYLSAVCLVTSGIWIGFSRAATFDLPLSVALEIALLAFFLWFQKGKDSFWYLCCFAIGLAMLAKGLVGIVLPGAIAGLFLLLTRNLGLLLKRPKLLLVGVIVFLATSATWYAPMLVRHGQEFVQEFFIQHHFQRFLTNKYHHPQPFYFFTLVAILGCFPWSLYLLCQAVSTLKKWRELISNAENYFTLFLWVWIIVIVGFFSLSTSKLTGYILPVFPAIALLIGEKLAAWWVKPPRTLWRWFNLITALIFLVAGIFVSTRAEKFHYAGDFRALALSAALLVAAFITISALLLRNERWATITIPFCFAGILIAVTQTAMPSLAVTDSTAELAVKAKAAARADERLIFFINNDHSIDYYAPNLPLRDAHSELITAMKPEEIAALIETQPTKSVLVMSPKQWLEGLEIMKSEKLATYHTWVLLRLTVRNQPLQ